MTMTHHTQLLNYIAQKINAQFYLEIGVYNPDHNFNKINVPHKIGIDPELSNSNGILKLTSDKYFYSVAIPSSDYFDLIFIDGLHHAEQVQKDILHSWACLNKGGVIVIHDTNPYSEHITHVPRDNGEWSGDVYKTVCNLDDKFTIDMDYGCTVLIKIDKKLYWICPPDIKWNYFNKHRKELLNLVSVEEGLKIIDSWVNEKQLVTKN